MTLIEIASGKKIKVVIEPVQEKDFEQITKKRYFFDWKKASEESKLYKLLIKDTNEIKGLIGLVDYPHENRIEVKLLAASQENVVLKKEKGKKVKIYEEIAGNLLAFAGRMAIKKYGELACISLVPKTSLKQHYCNEYGMLDAGLSVFLELESLHQLLVKYKLSK